MVLRLLLEIVANSRLLGRRRVGVHQTVSCGVMPALDRTSLWLRLLMTMENAPEFRADGRHRGVGLENLVAMACEEKYELSILWRKMQRTTYWTMSPWLYAVPSSIMVVDWRETSKRFRRSQVHVTQYYLSQNRGTRQTHSLLGPTHSLL